MHKLYARKGERMINTVVLDIGNVLARFRWEDYLDDCGYESETKRRIGKATVLSSRWKEWDRGEVEEQELIDACIAEEPELKQEILRLFFDDYEQLVEEYEYSADFIRQLKENGYRVYLLSNYSRMHFHREKKPYRFVDYVDGGVISYEVKHIKPEPEIYRILLEKYAIEPEKAVFLDDLEENLEAARIFGLHTIHVKNQEQALTDLRKLGVKI
jgi:putative hydrolase of the HAD superfamily